MKEPKGWALPGGWVDVDVSVKENTVKEVREEAGLEVRADRVIALQDGENHDETVYPWKVLSCAPSWAGSSGRTWRPARAAGSP